MVGGDGEAGGVDDELRLADLLAALSVATDLGMGHGPEKAVRACVLATELARAAGLAHVHVRDVYYSTLLIHLGCTAPSHELAFLFGDDVGVLPRAERTDEASVRESLALLGLVGRGTGSRRLRHLMRTVTVGKDGNRAILRSVCEVGTRLAERLHLGDRVATALGDSTEIWDGSGGAHGRSGEDIALSARFALVATQAVLFDRLGGPDAARDVVRDRSGHWFDPEVAATFARVGPDLLRWMADADVWHEVLEVEPRPVRCIPLPHLDEVARVFADVADLKSPDTLGHSTAVAQLAGDAAVRLGLPSGRVTAVRHAGFLHDLGRVAVSAGVWEQPRALTASQWEQVRLHPYHTERILSRSAPLAGLARVAGMHHERLDGSGYHHGAAGAAIATEARLLGAADAFQAMTQHRPHRPAVPPDQAAERLAAEAEAGRLDPDGVRAVIAAAGEETTAVPRSWPEGLTDREVDVLRLVATGATNRQIATELVISPRTAEHHVQHVYAKIGASTRAAAALFAMEHALVR